MSSRTSDAACVSQIPTSAVDYFDRLALNFHGLKELGTVSPEFYYRSNVTKEIRAYQTDAMGFGIGVHYATLEPTTYAASVVIAPPEHVTDGGALSDKKASRAWLATLPKRACVLTPAEDVKARRMAARVRANPLAGVILDGAECESEVYTTSLGFDLKAKIDIIDKGRRVWDLKTIASLDNVRDHVRDFCYLEQVVWYANVLTLARGREHTVGGLIFAESSEPHRVAVVQFTHDAIDNAAARLATWWEIYQRCVAADTWPNDPIEPITLTAEDTAA